MYCRATWYSGTPDRVDAGIEEVARLLSKIRKFPGYEGFLLLADRATGESAGIAFYKDKLSLKASGAAAAAVRRTGSNAIGGEVTGVEEYECALIDVAHPPAEGAAARLIRGTGRPEKTDQVIATLHDSVVPVLQQQPGYSASLSGVDRKSGRGFTCSIFDTPADLEASDGAIAGRRDQLQLFAEMADMSIHRFELVLVEFPATAAVA